MHPGNLIVEYEGVGDDGAGHAAGLAYVGHSQQIGDCLCDAWAGLIQFVEDFGGAVDALLQNCRCPVYGMLGNRDQADHVGQVLDRAVEPAGLREAGGDAVFGEDAV